MKSLESCKLKTGNRIQDWGFHWALLSTLDSYGAISVYVGNPQAGKWSGRLAWGIWMLIILATRVWSVIWAVWWFWWAEEVSGVYMHDNDYKSLDQRISKTLNFTTSWLARRDVVILDTIHHLLSFCSEYSNEQLHSDLHANISHFVLFTA